MGEVIATLVCAVGTAVMCSFLMVLLPEQPIMERIRYGKLRIPTPKREAIEALTAHKLAHQHWLDGQRLAAEWWEKACACPEVNDYRRIPGCTRIENKVCVEFMPGGIRWMEASLRRQEEAMEAEWRCRPGLHKVRTGPDSWGCGSRDDDAFVPTSRVQNRQ